MDVRDLESPIIIPSSYPPSPQVNERVDYTIAASSTIPPTRSSRLVFSAIAAVSLLGLVYLFYHGGGGARRELQFDTAQETPVDRRTAPRGSAEGVSEKSNGPILGATPAYSWTNAMLVWQRTAYHFQPQENWMNDPYGPMHYKEWYHIFYKYNPDSAVWGNIKWGHAVSRDLIHWHCLPLAMVPDRWYDANGVFTGSATLLPDGRIAMVYTGATPRSVQVRNLAFPADPDDPLLINWNKSESNPVLLPPNWIWKTDFPDPTTAWYVPSVSAWRLVIGSKDADHNGVALVYQTKDFITYELLPDFLHLVNRTGMWEFLDFYPVSTGSSVGLDTSTGSSVDRRTASRGSAEGVWEKSNEPILGATPAYTWTNAMLLWQRTAYHFQPQENWMSDPNGPMYYKGWYHIFYQYNPDSAVWGNITWGHAVSRDLIHWFFLPLAMAPDRWYDTKGVFSGSATLLPDGRIAMVYTGATPESVQVQNLAFPADPDDPLLINWNKSESNPVLLPPNWIWKTDFRDPTTAWYVPSESAWRLAIGSKDADHNGVALVYQTKDFITYELLPDFLHLVNRTGMWECLDFYPVSTGSSVGLDTSTGPGPGVKHVLKASLDDSKHDYYAIGTYNGEEGTWTPDEPEMDVGFGLRYDYGKYYASKTFYDPVKERRVLWGWIGETGNERTDPLKAGASLQSIPRTVIYDAKTKRNLLQWPIDEVESLRSSSQEYCNIKLSAGSVVPLNVTKATQVDIEAVFEIDSLAVERALEADVGYNCSTSGGAAGRGALGPFGLLVLADQESTEQIAVYFYLGRAGTDGGITTYFCQDEPRSSLASDLVKTVYGSSVLVLDGERLTVRTLVDRSVVESFAQGGRTCITSRVYPTKANHGEARVILFNNSTGAPVTAKSLKIWEMDSALIHPYSAQTEAL